MRESVGPTRPFYVTGGALKPEEPSYVERRADTELFESLLAGDFCYVLTARQMGKSSLMARAAKRLEQEGVSSAIVDLTQIGSERGAQAAAQWYYGVAYEVHRRLRIGVPLRPWWQERSDLPPAQRLTHFLRELVLTHCPGRVVIFVDEIDSTIGLPFADDFFAALRACFNARAIDSAFERLTFVLLGVATPDQLIQDPARTPFNIGKRIDLADFTLEEAQKLAPELHLDAVEAGRRLERVLHWTAGHPYLTQALCRAVRDKGESRTVEEVVDPRVEDLFLSSRAQREETNLKHARARLERRGPEGRRLLQLYSRVRLGRLVPDQPTSPLFAQLKLAGVVKATDEGRLAVRNRIYEAVFTPEWSKAAMPPDRGKQLAAVTLLVSLAGVIVWYAAFQPRAYERALLSAIEDDGFNTALEAYTSLRANPFSKSLATDLMQRFWEQRGMRYALANRRDESLLSHIQGLTLKDTAGLRRQAGNLVGSDYTRVLLTLRHPAEVREVVFSPKGKILVTRTKETIGLWEAQTGKALAPPIQQKAYLPRVVLSSDGRTLATGTEDGNLRLWDSLTGKPVALFWGRRSPVSAVAFSPDGERIAAGYTDGSIQLWNTRRTAPGPLMKHRTLILSVTFSPDGHSLASGSADHTARLWDASTGKQIGSPMQHKDSVPIVAFSPNGRIIATISGDDTAQLWEVATGRPLLSPLLHRGDVFSIAFSPDGFMLATASEDNTAQLWDTRTGRPIVPRLRHRGSVYALAFSPNGHILATGSADNTVALWDVHTGKLLTPPLWHEGSVLAVAFSHDGQSLATGSKDGTARVWGIPTRSSPQFKQPHSLTGSSIALSSDGTSVFLGSIDNSVSLFDARTVKPLLTFSGHAKVVNAMALSPDGRTLATASGDKTVRLWNSRTGEPLAPPLWHDAYVFAIAFSPDGRALATGSLDGTARLWNSHTGKPLTLPLQHPAGVIAVAISSDGEKLATACGDETVWLWSTRSGKQAVPPLQHAANVFTLAFSPDSRTLATGSSEYTVQLWETQSGKPLVLPALRLQSQPRTIAFSPSGKMFFVATDRWLNSYSWHSGKATPRSSQLLHGVWSKAFRFLADCDQCLQVALRDTGSSYHLESVHLDGPIDSPIEGDPKELLEKWKVRLGLTFDDQMRPAPY